MTKDDISPVSLSNFIGQSSMKRHLRVYIDAARSRGEMLDHTLFYGAPGLGKTTLAKILAVEMGSAMRSVAAPAITKTADVASLLTGMEEKEVLFIDEIHRLTSAAEEMLYSAMDKFQIDLLIGEGVSARVMNVQIPEFTLVGATTRIGQLRKPFRDRFGIHCAMKFYCISELKSIISEAAKSLNLPLDDAAVNTIAERGRGTPRIVLRLLRRLRDFATVEQKNVINNEACEEILKDLGIDHAGLDSNDRAYLRFLVENYRTGCVGIHTISAALGERREAVEDVVEPYLIQLGFLKRTSQGRMVTQKAVDHLSRV